MRLKVIPPLMPILVEQPRQGDDWIHEVKLDGSRSQLIIDEDGIGIRRRKGHDWTSIYRDLVKEAASLGAENAIVDGLSDFGEPRMAITSGLPGGKSHEPH
ncbi:hypothetical protein [Mesorhizobium sp. Mes31]|uniref:ATP-dependent DNA ligase n=1 Tax=Mesorhizobium sp. Mes31 TaxID=2926017 RepID=UPI002118B4A0|nr:hypothetical protein [Mesorhizobium sp. Mes31]